uniref:Uncharacterized protein n=1 Tax=Anguilla anguilla TaxID=7936 RepID=A0A0E9WNN8_ANGAN
MKAMYSCRDTWPSLLGSTVSRMDSNSGSGSPSSTMGRS